MAGEDLPNARGTRSESEATSGQTEELPALHRETDLTPSTPRTPRTPLFYAQNSERYARQQLLLDYEHLTGSNLIVVIDQIFSDNLTYLEELLYDCEPNKPLHVLLASPGGDGETAIRMVRSMQTRCTELVVLLPDMAKSAATLMSLGADRIIMGPGGDLGPVDPQFQLDTRHLVGAKDIVAAVDEAEERIKKAPETYPLFAGLLADVNMLMVEQARSALDRTEALVREALACVSTRSPEDVETLAAALRAPLIDDPASHSAVIPVSAASGFGLPATPADTNTKEWAIIWSLWCRYFTLGCYPAGYTAVYEGRRASHILNPTAPK